MKEIEYEYHEPWPDNPPGHKPKKKKSRGCKKSTRIRRRLVERHGPICHYCGEEATPPTLDHVVPVVKGGPTTEENCVIACEACNFAKGDLSVDEFLKGRGLE